MKKIVFLAVVFMVCSTMVFSQELSLFENWLLKNTPIEEVKAKIPDGFIYMEKINNEEGIEYHFVRKTTANNYKLIVAYEKDGIKARGVSYQEYSEKIWGRLQNIRDLGYKLQDNQVMGKVEVSFYKNFDKSTALGLILNENDMILKLNFMRL